MDKPSTINLTHEEVASLCPEAHAELVEQNIAMPSLTPIKDLTFWLARLTDDGDLAYDDFAGLIDQYPDYVLQMQDPNDDANVSLTWDGNEWG